MKSALTPLALSLPLLASAQAITLNPPPEVPVPCGAGLWCPTVPNDAGVSILLYGSTNYQDVGMILTTDGGSFTYGSVSYRGYGNIFQGTCPNAPAVGTIILSNIPMTGIGAAAGTSYTISATFSCTQHYGGSGRGQSYHQVWNLISGTVVTP